MTAKRQLSFLLACTLFWGTAGAALAETVERTEKYWRNLTVGDSGYDVLTMKRRLQELGYYSVKSVSDEYTDKALPIVKKFQACNGLEQTGEMSIAELALLHSAQAQPSRTLPETPVPEFSPTPRPSPTPPPPPLTAIPPRDEKGFLVEPLEYYKEDEENGEWMYLSDRLQIHIKRFVDTQEVLLWFETEIFVKEGEHFMAIENNPDKPGTALRNPAEIAKMHRVVLGFTDDFYGHRVRRKLLIGTVIRNGKILSDKTFRKEMNYLPNLDLLAEFQDGSLKAYRCTEHTAQELLDMGVINTFCFGPVVLQNGETDQRILDKRYEVRAPRQVLGMIEPGHYLLLTMQGRIKDSRGIGLIWAAEHLKKRHVVEAVNLDGGNTVALVFRGKMLNRLATWKNEKFVRSVTSLIGLGYTGY